MKLNELDKAFELVYNNLDKYPQVSLERLGTNIQSTLQTIKFNNITPGKCVLVKKEYLTYFPYICGL